MSLDKIEDMFLGIKPMLAYLVEDLVHKNRLNEAKGVYLRNNLQDTVRPDVKEHLDDYDYDPSKDVPAPDFFGPVSTAIESYIVLPDHVKVQMISTVADIPKLNELLKEPFVGVDSEWRPSLTKFHKTAPALFQISGASTSFLIDFYNLKENLELDAKLSEIFNNESSIIVGFSFNSDIDQFTRKFTKLKFYRFIKNFIDAQSYFSRVMLAAP